MADADRDAIVDEAANRVLDASEHEVIHLRWVLDYANEDIAEQMGMASTDAVRVVVQRSKRRLAKAPLGLVIDTLEGEVVVGLGDAAKIGQRVAYFRPLVESRAADDLVR